MRILVDTNILLRSAEPGHVMNKPASDAVDLLRTQGETLCLVPQNLYEFWSVCTRPLTANGLGKSVAEAVAELNNLKVLFTLLDDTPALYPMWERVVATHAVTGKNAHDARLVAAMLVHGLTHVLTFNDADFRRFTSIAVLTPAGVLASLTAPLPPVPPIPPTPPASTP